MKTIIGLVGAKGSGKTTAFEQFQKLLPEVKEITLAKKLKEVSAEVFDIPKNHFDAQNLKEVPFPLPVFLTEPVLRSVFEKYDLTPDYDKFIRPHIGKTLDTPRQIAQYIGTEVLRAVIPNIHCIHAIPPNGIVGVVTDMRFPNEYDYFKEHYEEFIPIYIENMAAEHEASQDTHVSEAHLKTLSKQCEVTFHNNGSLANFLKTIELFAKRKFK